MAIKKSTKNVAQKPSTKRISAAKKTVAKRSARPASNRLSRAWHLRLTLHPVSIMALLCSGVFLAATTFAVSGESFVVSGQVAGSVPSVPAIITNPTDSQRFSNPDITVTGSCPNLSYVRLSNNSTYIGSAWCKSGGYSIALSLVAGTNLLSAQDYNALNQAGPTSPAITTYYDPPVTPVPPTNPAQPSGPVPAATPIQLSVTQVDNGVMYESSSAIEQTDNYPTFTGTAPPFARVRLELHSNPVICLTTANSTGFWRCTVPTPLPVGEHSVTITAVTTDGQTLSLPVFHIMVVGAAVQPSAGPAPTIPVNISSQPYQYQVYPSGQQVPISFMIGGGRGPYSIVIDWGDGSTDAFTQALAGPFTGHHAYDGSKIALSGRAIKIRVTDADGVTTVTQLPAIIRSTGSAIAGASAGNIPSWWQTGLSALHGWLWVLWPAYSIILLMIASFWLGERRQQEEDGKVVRRATRRTPRPKKHA